MGEETQLVKPRFVGEAPDEFPGAILDGVLKLEFLDLNRGTTRNKRNKTLLEHQGRVGTPYCAHKCLRVTVRSSASNHFTDRVSDPDVNNLALLVVGALHLPLPGWKRNHGELSADELDSRENERPCGADLHAANRIPGF
jgi:hypothetical protein